jgi:citrate lyase subunit beta / citryl-CoA lyase
MTCAYLFLPADRLERLVKARATGASVIVDLEDGVGVEHKDSARRRLISDLDGGEVLVRINGPGEHRRDDLAVLAEVEGLIGVIVPKVESPSDLADVREVVADDVLMIALVETPVGVERSRSLAALDSVGRLALGSVDYCTSIGVAPNPRALAHPRTRLVVASAIAGLAPPIDGPFLAFADDDGMRTDSEEASDLGMGAKLCIHPRQVPVAQQVFDPSSAVDWARSVLAASAEHNTAGAFAWQGQMIDEPVLARARAILERAATARPGPVEPGRT